MALLLVVSAAAALSVWTAVRYARPAPGVYYNDGLLAGSLRRDEPVPLYSPDRSDPWNRLHHLIFSKAIRGRAVGAIAAHHQQTIVTRIEGGDRLISPWAGGVDYVLADPRFVLLAGAISDVEQDMDARQRSLSARFAFQQEIWEAYDDLETYVGREGRYAQRARGLMPRLARLIFRLALTDAELQKLGERSAHDVPDAGEWRELTVRSGHAHEFQFDHRIAFRTLVRLPQAYRRSAWLEQQMGRMNALERLGNTDGKEVAFMSAVSSLSAVPPGTVTLLASYFLAIDSLGRVRATNITRDLQRVSVSESGRMSFDVREFRLERWLSGVNSPLAATGATRPVYSDTQPFPLETEEVTSLKSQEEHCVHCHSGPMFTTLNRTSGFLPVQLHSFADPITAEQVAAAKQNSDSFLQLVQDGRVR